MGRWIQKFQAKYRRERETLLQTALRPESSYSIELEYPLVLAQDASSYCWVDGTRILAHANFWPRCLLSGSHKNSATKIGLIGNVVTDPDWRGKGLMRQLLGKVFEDALVGGYAGLILWSEQVDLYKSLGFLPYGRELRYFYCLRDLPEFPAYEVEVLEGCQLDLEDCAALLAMRYPCASVERSAAEFQALLQIPDTYLLLSFADGLQAYGILGKGQDLVCTLHEWGGLNPLGLLAIIRHVLAVSLWPSLGLIGPEEAGTWGESLRAHAYRVEQRDMSLAHWFKKCDDFYIWGLDAI